MQINNILIDHDDRDDIYNDERKLTISPKSKYKTLGELKKEDIKTISFVCSKMNESPLRNYLDKWLFDSHYMKLSRERNLTRIVKQLGNKVCYREIMKRCFDNVDVQVSCSFYQ
jgi:hypothetical protein